MTDEQLHTKFMRAALTEARKSVLTGDVPIGAVIVFEGRIIARGRNMVEKSSDPTAHAEMIAIKKAVKRIGYKHLIGCSLYVTLEPCSMCSGAIVSSRIKHVYFGAHDPKAGACGSLYNICSDPRLNHRCEVHSGLLADESSSELKSFFAQLRSREKPKR
jgi:tRNA(adenine34) deaminase